VTQGECSFLQQGVLDLQLHRVPLSGHTLALGLFP
jgi:hypothetical protein